MLPILATILGLIPQVLDRVLPGDSPEDRKIKLGIQEQMQNAIQAVNLKQLEINMAEAANPNRSWPTWREMLGYVCVAAVAYHFVIQQFIAFILGASGYSLVLPVLDMSGVMTILSAMLGVHFVDSRYNSDPGKMPNIPPAQTYVSKPMPEAGDKYNGGTLVEDSDGNLIWKAD